MTPRHALLWFLLLSTFGLLASCTTTAAEVPAAVGAGVAVAVPWLTEILGIVKPFLQPEQFAALSTKIASAQNWAEAIAQTVGVIGQGLADLRASTEATAEQVAEGITKTEAAGLMTGSVVLDRVVSAGQRAHRRARAAKESG